MIFLFSWGFYAFIGGIFASETLLPLHQDYIHDLYWGFDNAYLNTSVVRHPLLKIFTILLGKVLFFTTYQAIFLIMICSFLLALQQVFVYKYLTQIIHLSRRVTLWILLFYLGTSQQLILSFTFESYTFSTCFLSIFLYFHAYYHQKKGATLPTKWFYTFFVLIGGITITNGIKVLLITYRENQQQLLKYLGIILLVCLLISTIFWDKILNSLFHSTQFLKSGEHYFADVFYLFLGGSVVFPQIKIGKLLYEDIEQIFVLYATYPSFFSLKTLVITHLLLLLVYSVIKNFRNRLVNSLLILFGADVFIHCILRLGLNEAQIFGGNYTIIYPLLLGYLFKKEYNHQLLFYQLILLIILIYYINFQDLHTIFHFGKTYYPK